MAKKIGGYKLIFICSGFITVFWSPRTKKARYSPIIIISIHFARRKRVWYISRSSVEIFKLKCQFWYLISCLILDFEKHIGFCLRISWGSDFSNFNALDLVSFGHDVLNATFSPALCFAAYANIYPCIRVHAIKSSLITNSQTFFRLFPQSNSMIGHIIRYAYSHDKLATMDLWSIMTSFTQFRVIKSRVCIL